MIWDRQLRNYTETFFWCDKQFTYIFQAHALHKSGHSEEAESLLRDIVSSDSNHVTALHYLSVILGETRRHSEALGLLQRALVVVGDDSPLAAELHFNAGNHYKDLKQMGEAFEVGL